MGKIILGVILMAALVAGLCVQKPEGLRLKIAPQIQPAEELKLSVFSEAFKDSSTLIVVGAHQKQTPEEV